MNATHTTDVFATFAVKLEACIAEHNEPYLADAEDVLEVRTALNIIRDVMRRSTRRQQGMFPTITADVIPHDNADAIGPVYGQLIPFMQACCDAINELSDPDGDELELAFVLNAIVNYLEGLDTTVRETY